MGLGKLYPWQIDNQIYCFELGSLFVIHELRKKGLGKFLVERLIENYRNIGLINTPLIAVVATDNEDSLQLFRRKNWIEVNLLPKQTGNFSYLTINNGPNIFKDWGKSSVVFVYHKIFDGQQFVSPDIVFETNSVGANLKVLPKQAL